MLHILKLFLTLVYLAPGCAASTDVTELHLRGKILVGGAAGVATVRRHQRLQDGPTAGQGRVCQRCWQNLVCDNVFKKG